MRGLGITRWLVAQVPDALAPVLLALTFLGDPLFLTTAGAVLYWLGPRYGLISRRNGARLLTITLGALGITVLLKYGFAMPRPPTSIHLVPEDGFGFPSGHATGSAAFYGALAVLLDWRDKLTRYVLGAGMMIFVSLTRLLLGVHYLVDVLAGIATGLAFTVLALYLTARAIRHGFRLAAVIGLATPLVLWPGFNAAVTVGGTLGALTVWERYGDVLEHDQWTVSYPLAAAGFVGFGGLAGAVYVSEPIWPVVVVLVGVVAAGFVGLPVIQMQLD